MEELYYGNINPDTQYFSKQSEFGRAMKVLTDREEYVDEIDGIARVQMKRYVERLSERFTRSVAEDITRELMMYE